MWVHLNMPLNASFVDKVIIDKAGIENLKIIPIRILDFQERILE
jgi:hypothetical protein